MNTKQAATRLGKSAASVLAYIKKGQLRATKAGGRDWHITPAALTAFAALTRPVGYPAGRKPKPGDGRLRENRGGSSKSTDK